jgi:NAD(P)-dependent dehydrogenase (short-subunit alcohol dehydrogenase family)
MTERHETQRQSVVVPRRDRRFAGKVAFITGATSGIGRRHRPRARPAAVLWLCSDEASFTIGHAMVIDGGQTA